MPSLMARTEPRGARLQTPDCTGTVLTKANKFRFRQRKRVPDLDECPARGRRVTCAFRPVRYWKGAFVPGAVAGWVLGLLTLLGLALLSVVS